MTALFKRLGRKWLRKEWLFIGSVFLIASIGLQLIRPKLANPPVTADLKAPLEVKQILKTSCYNCHSNETDLPWFDQVVPAYWLVAKDVKIARRHLNFSQFDRLPSGQQKAILYEAVNQIQLGVMPPRDYRLVHPESVITSGQLDVLKNYLHPAESTPSTDAASKLGAAADAQYDQWIHGDGSPIQVRPAPNGIEFPREYKDWKAISTTERFDNDSLRVILGNEIAVKAIESNQIHPWPDGSTFAKVAWHQRIDDNGMVRPGEFYQVEFMIKDSKKYASTKGWGWARWRGMDLQPYGKTKAFTTECVSCHLPLRNQDFVFTTPFQAHP